MGLQTELSSKDDARKLKRAQSYESVQATLKSAKISDLRYTKFSIGGFPGVKHAVFIPDTQTLTAPVLEQICVGLDREMPSMLLSGVSSLCHPTKMSTAQLRKCPGFGPLMSEVRNSLNLQTQGKASPDKAKASEETNRKLDKLVDIVDHVLEKKIASSVRNLATAAYRTNVWTLTGPQISNFEIFMQQCIDNGEAGCFRMVTAHMQDKSYMQSTASKSLMKDLFDGSQAMSPEMMEIMQPVQLPGDLWDPLVNKQNPEFRDHGYDYWSFDSLDQKMITGHPITLWPWPHADLFFLFYREETIIGAVQADVDWEYTTEYKLDLESVPFKAEDVGPLGYVFIGAPYCWQPQMKRRLLQGIKLGNPVVVLDNTPNVAKQVAVFIKLVRKVWSRQPLSSCRPYLTGERISGSPTAVELIQAMSPAKVMKYIEAEFDSSGMNNDERLTLSDIVGLLDLVKRRPHAFKEMVAAVDPLTDSAEGTMSQLMSVFTSHHSGTKELSSTEIHHSLVLKAWDLHLKLTRRARNLCRAATALEISVALLMLIATSLAMWKVYLTLRNEHLAHENIVDVSLVIFPVVVLLLLTIQGSFQLGQQWASVHMGSTRVVSEIYYFLGNVGPYRGLPATNQKRFLKRLRELVKRLAVSGIREEDLARGGGSKDQEVGLDFELLSEEIRQSLYGITPLWYPCRLLRDSLRSLGISSWSSLLDGPDQKDLTAYINAESYVEMRMVPLKRYYIDWVRQISRLRMVLHCFLMLVLSVAVGLGATDYSILIPVALATASFVTFLLNWLTPPEIFGAVNNALTTLHKLDLRWKGSDLRENRSDATKQRLISVTENLVLNVERAASRGNAVPEIEEEEDRGDEPAEPELTMEYTNASGRLTQARPDKMRELRSRPISVAVTPLNGGSGAATPSGSSPLPGAKRLAGT